MKRSCLLWLLFLLPFLASADLVDDGNKKYYGRVTQLTSTSITIQDACDGNLITIKWTDQTHILFSARCVHPGYEETSAEVPKTIKCKGRKLFHIKFKNGDIAYATMLRLTDRYLYIQPYSPRGDATQLKISVKSKNIYKAIEWVCYKVVCEEKLPRKAPNIHIDL